MSLDAEDITRTLAKGRPSRRGARWLIALLLVLAAGGALWVWQARQSADAGVVYVTEAAIRGPLVVTVTATGTVQPTTQVEVSSELSGTLTTVEADFNDQVEVGQVLARLDDIKPTAQVANAEAALLAARARVTQAEATMRMAKENYEAQSALDQRGVSTRRDFVSYEVTYARATAEIEIARAEESTARANLTLQQSDLAKTVIRSPIKGVVLDRAAEVGQIVASSLNTPTLFTLAEDLSRMELRVDIDEADIGRVAVGNPATFTVDAYDGRTFPATITQVRFAPETTEGVVTYKAVLTVDNTDFALRPGMTATARITVTQMDDVLQVPNAALRYAPPQEAIASGQSGGGLLGLILPRPPAGSGDAAGGLAHSLWVVRGGSPVEVEITPGDTDGLFTAILSGDLAEGDAVITDQVEAR